MGLRKQFIKNFIFPTGPLLLDGFNNNNHNNNNNNNGFKGAVDRSQSYVTFSTVFHMADACGVANVICKHFFLYIEPPDH